MAGQAADERPCQPVAEQHRDQARVDQRLQGPGLDDHHEMQRPKCDGCVDQLMQASPGFPAQSTDRGVVGSRRAAREE
jgi:hypothetical protein